MILFKIDLISIKFVSKVVCFVSTFNFKLNICNDFNTLAGSGNNKLTTTQKLLDEAGINEKDEL